MTPLTLTLAGFRSFRRPTTFTWPAGPGFYFITGRNELHPELGGNATGKSSLADGLCWVLYGKTARGHKAGNAANWVKPRTRGSLTFNHRRTQYTLARTWRPIGLTLTALGHEPRPVTQGQVDALLGCTYETFLHTGLMGQFGTFFFDLKAADKLTFFSDALGLGRWEAAVVTARAKHKQALEAAGKLEVAIARGEGELKGMRAQRDTAREGVATFKANRRNEVATIKARGHKAEEKLTLITGVAVGVADAYRKLKGKAAEAERHISRHNEAREAARNVLLHLERDRRECLSALDTLKQQKQKLKAFEGECPACLQRVSQRHVKHALVTLNLRREFERAQLASIEVKLQGATRAAAKADAAATAGAGKYRTTRDSAAKALAALGKGKAAITAARALVAHYEAEAAKAAAWPNPHKGALEAARKRIRHLKAGLGALREDQARAARDAGDWDALAGYFRDLRLWVIEVALTELELAVNSGLIELGLNGWAVKFAVEKATASGKGVIKGFAVLITNEQTPKPVLWDCWAGGETQRLRVAGAAGLASLIRSRTGLKLPFELWDEPTAHLSEEGIACLLEYFAARAAAGRQVWLIDHRSLSYGGFTGRVTVVKGAKGSRIEE